MEKIAVDEFDERGNLISERSSWIYAALIKHSTIRRLAEVISPVALISEGGYYCEPGNGAIVRPTFVPDAQYIIGCPEGFEENLRARITEVYGTTLENSTIQQFFDAFEAQCIATPVGRWNQFSNNAMRNDNAEVLNGAFNEDTEAKVITADGDEHAATLHQMTTRGNMDVFLEWVESCLPSEILALPTARIIHNDLPSAISWKIHIEGTTGDYKEMYGDTCDVEFIIRF